MIYIPALLLAIAIFFIVSIKPAVFYSNNKTTTNSKNITNDTNINYKEITDNTFKDNNLVNMFANLCSGSNKKLHPIDGVPINRDLGEACYCSTRMYNAPP